MEVIIAIVGSGALSALISGIFSLILAKKSRKSNITDGLQVLLYDRIKHLCQTYIKFGCITYEDWEDLTRMHIVYHDQLHGNGFLDNLMAETSKLPKVTAYPVK